MVRYYELDYEDIVAGMPTRFKYHQVPAADYGLTAEEILLLPDKTLNQYAGLKKYAPFREDTATAGNKFTSRRWEHFKKKNGVEQELNELFEELDKKKGAPMANKDGKSSGKKKDRTNRRREYAEELKKTKSKHKGGKKSKQGASKPEGGLSEDRMSLYQTSKKKKSK